jgi:hypothetical protein
MGCMGRGTGVNGGGGGGLRGTGKGDRFSDGLQAGQRPLRGLIGRVRREHNA